MTALLALASALIIGGSDFGGGLATRHDSAFRVSAVAQILGGATALALALVVGADEIVRADVVGGAVAGLSGSFSLICLYRALSLGVMSVIAPTTAVIGATIPAAVGLARGESLSALTGVGLAVAIGAILLITRDPGKGSVDETPRAALLLAIAAGIGFALFYLALSETNDEAGMWPLVVARVVSAPLVCLIAWRVSGRVRTEVPFATRLAVATGVTEMLANALLLVALRRDEIAIASVFRSLYPVSTVVLAWLFLRERVSRAQLAGVALAVGALALVASQT